MAIDSLNVTVDEVLGRIPFDTSQVGANTDPISTSDVEDAIEGAASDMTGVLSRSGTDSSSLKDEELRQIQTAVRDGAAADLMAREGHVGDVQQELKEAFEDAKDKYSDSAELAGTAGGRVKSNVDTSPDRESPWKGTDHWEM